MVIFTATVLKSIHAKKQYVTVFRIFFSGYGKSGGFWKKLFM
jgi:hypothetical protein